MVELGYSSSSISFGVATAELKNPYYRLIFFSLMLQDYESLLSPPPPTTRVSVPPKQEASAKNISFDVATAELFLSIASRFIRATGNAKEGEEEKSVLDPKVVMFSKTEIHDPSSSSWWWMRRNKERIGSVIEDPLQPQVVWEQTQKDVEAEKRKKAVTSPGFSFSAAGLLFPYHFGVAQFLIQKGYIKEATPLAGSSDGAIVCAIFTSSFILGYLASPRELLIGTRASKR